MEIMVLIHSSLSFNIFNQDFPLMPTTTQYGFHFAHPHSTYLFHTSSIILDHIIIFHEDLFICTCVAKQNNNSNSSSLIMRCCQADKCSADLTEAKQYHRRHKVCEQHAKAQIVIVGGIRQRFCQQCSRFHEICEFDESKRSCRRRLAGHNERRRKNTGDHHLQFSHNEATPNRKGTSCSSSSSAQLNDIICG